MEGNMLESIGTWWMWTGFFGLVVVMLAIDLFALGGRTAHREGSLTRETANDGWCAHLCKSLSFW